MKNNLIIGLIYGVVIGLIIGIGGECLIPEKYAFNPTYGCLQDTASKLVALPRLRIYDPKAAPSSDNPKYNIKRNYPIGAFFPSVNIRNYAILFNFLSGSLRRVSQDECNKLVDLEIQGDYDHFSQYFKYSKKTWKELGLQ